MQLTAVRLLLLLAQLFVILSNRTDQVHPNYLKTVSILTAMPELNSPMTQEFKTIEHSFRAANTMGLVFVIMELIILYVGTNRFRLKATIYSNIYGTKAQFSIFWDAIFTVTIVDGNWRTCG